jgi:hypothetical protein
MKKRALILAIIAFIAATTSEPSINMVRAEETQVEETLDQNLLSVVFDYEGNLWFATGGFRIYPDRKQQGTFGYVSRAAIDKILNGEDVDLSDAVFVYELEPGEGAENGIAASKEGAVILTNLKCYLLQADNGVKKDCRGSIGINFFIRNIDLRININRQYLIC